MTYKPEVLRSVPLFASLDDDETAVLASQVEIKNFTRGQGIYKMGEPGRHAYLVISGQVQVSTIDEDQQEVVVDEPAKGDFFGFASMLEQTSHQTTAVALKDTVCLEVSRDDIAVLLEQKPHAGMDLLSTLGRQFHASQQLVRIRATRNPNEVIEQKASWGERVADSVAHFGGSWTFIIIFIAFIGMYTLLNVELRMRAWDPYPFILLNLFLSMLAAIQAPVILMSQNRQDTRDRLRGELDYEVNRRAEAEVQTVVRRLTRIDEKIDELGNLVRGTNERKDSELHGSKES
jgi:CRP/FNR family transcriptional regulator, cyclic AMP receptor protein